jgi:hypothetical protein
VTALSRARSVWAHFWWAPVDRARIDVFATAFAATMLVYFAAWARHAREWLTVGGYHPGAAVDRTYAPQVPLLPEAALVPVGVVFFAGLLAYTLGVRRHLTVWIPLAGAVYVVLADPISAFTLNRLYVIVFAVLALSHRPSRPDDAGEPVLAWPERALQVLLCTHYLVAGVCKLTQGDWLGGENVLWTQVQGIYMTDLAATLVTALPLWAWTGLERAALLFELVAPVLLVVPRLRPIGFVVGISMHVIIALTMEKLGYFSAQMIAFYLLFRPPSWLRPIRERLFGTRDGAARAPLLASSPRP